MDHTDDPRPEKLPGTYKEFVARFPELGKAHEDIAKAVERYGPLDIAGHSDIAPGRKTDPGPFFDWPRFRASL